MPQPVVIHEGSPAWEYLSEAFTAPEKPRKVSIDVRTDGVAIKVNEYCWSPTLATEASK